MTIACLALLFGVSRVPSNSQSAFGPPAVTLSFVCASQHKIPADVRRTVTDWMSKHDLTGVTRYGDRAALIKMGDPAHLYYFIPMSCGATGNCTWAVAVKGKPGLAGVVEGAVLRVREEGIDAFGRGGAGEGTLERYGHDAGQFVSNSTEQLHPDIVDRFAVCIDNEGCCP